MKEESKIPFVKAARVGNFKVWRSRITVSGMDSKSVEAINVSNLDGSWKVQIPQTMMMFGTISQGFAVDDEQRREQFLGAVFGNIYNISTNSSVALHDGLCFLTEMLTFPYMLLDEKEMVKRMKAVYKADGVDKKDADSQIEEMVAYRSRLYELIGKKKADYLEEYERQRLERREKEPDALKQLEQDALAEQAMEVLEKKTS